MLQEGWTALLLACEQGSLEIVEILLEHNAAIDITTLVHVYIVACEKFQFNFIKYYDLYTDGLDSCDDSL